MLEKRHKQLLEEGDKLFSDTKQLPLLWQELAENFYPERADFTVSRSIGEEFAGNLDNSYPIVARRDLGNALGAMLRPPGKDWFNIRLKRESEDEKGRKWLEMATRVQRRAIYDRESGFIKATKEGDHDFATFGACVISSESASSPTSGFVLLHRSWHLRDVRWAENAFGQINHVQRKWKVGARELKNYFNKKVHPSVLTAAEKEPFKEFQVCHAMILAQDYEKTFRQPWVSVYIDVDNQFLLEEVGSWTKYYIIPRWETVSGSAYPYSPATVAALPDARLIQAITYSILTSAEFAVEPAMIGVPEAIKGNIEIFPGGFTPRDGSYDERLGEVLRPLNLGGEKSLPIGMKISEDTRAMIANAFYLSKLALPDPGLGGMSPFEVSQRVEEFIRQNLPLFEPMETDYNGDLMEQDFNILLRSGAFGSPKSMPESLSSQETEFRFENPLRESIDGMAGQKLMEAGQLVQATAQFDPLAPKMVDFRTGLRDALHGRKIPAKWITDEDQMAEFDKQAQQVQQAQAAMETLSAGGQVAEQVGKGGQAIREAIEPTQAA